MENEAFVKILWSELKNNEPFGDEKISLLHYGHVTGWLEDQDEIHPADQLNKRTAARILHQFMKIELHIPDAPDIRKAEVLKDLYTCHVCANHVAQMYVKDLMEGEEEVDPVSGEPVLIFNMLAPVSEKKITEIIEKIKKLA